MPQFSVAARRHRLRFSGQKSTPHRKHGTGKQLEGLNRQAQGLLKRGKADEAAAIIVAGEPLANRVLAVPRPTLSAMESASDRDELYGRMLLSNHNYGWARMMFQKNLARWKNWRPQTD